MKLATKAILAPLVLITLLIKTMPEVKASERSPLKKADKMNR